MMLCDLHTHVLPGVDDGAPTMEYALQMLQNAVASDVKVLAVTPHCNGLYGNYLDKNLKLQFSQLEQAAKDIPVQLIMGAEAQVNDSFLLNLQNGRFATLNGSRYLLTEFPLDTRSDDFEFVLAEICNCGYIPLIAHPERYRAVGKMPQIVMQWLDMGCHIQITGGSISGEYGSAAQRAAAFLLKHDLVACIASDAHGLHSRSNFLMDIYDHLSVQYSKQYARCMMYENPMRICGNQDI